MTIGKSSLRARLGTCPGSARSHSHGGAKIRPATVAVMTQENIDSAGLFSTLPTELLQLILDQIPSYPLLSVALTSKYLYRASIFAYLRSQGIQNPEKRLTLILEDPYPYPPYYDVISALRLPFVDLETEELICTFPEQTRKNGDTLLQQVDRLRLAVSNLRYIKRVVLVFKLPLERRLGFSPSNEGEFKEWARALGLLLNTILEKGCESLDLGKFDASGMSKFYQLSPSNSSSSSEVISTTVCWLSHSLKRIGIKRDSVLSGETWRFEGRNVGTVWTRRVKDVVEISQDALEKTNLRHIEINSTSLIYPPLLQWTYSTLLASPLERMKTSVLTPWPVINTLFPRAVGDKLKHMEIDSYDYPSPREFNGWLASFHLLTFLSIHQFPLHDSSDMPQSHSRPPSPLSLCPTLPRLIEMSIPASWFEIHFTPDYSRHFPELQRLTITFGPNHDMIRGPGTPIRALLAALSKTKTTNPKPELDITFEFTDLQQSLLKHCQSETASEMDDWAGCFTRIVLNLAIDRPLASLETITGPQVPTAERTASWLNNFRGMRCLALNVVSEEKLQRHLSNPWVTFSREDTFQHIDSINKALQALGVLKRLIHFEVNGSMISTVH